MNVRTRTPRPRAGRRFGAVALTTALATVLSVGLVAGQATADDSTTPPWQTGAGVDPNRAATLAFYDAAGNQVFGGSTAAPVSAYAVASGTVRAGDDHATLYAYTPDAGKAPGDWSGTQLTAAAAYPVAGAPASISTILPALKGTADDTSIADHIAAYPNAAASGAYQGVYELRLRTSKAGALPTVGNGYAVADIKVTGTSWEVVYGSKTTATVTTTAPASSTYGKAFAVSATVAATGAVPTGTATLKDGATVIGTATLTAAGKASFTVAATRLAPGKHSLVVAYAGSGAVGAASSPAKVVTVAKAAATIKNKLSPAKIKRTKRANVVVTVAATGVAPTGTVTVYDGAKVVARGTLTAARKGVITIKLPKLKAGKHKIHAVYAGSAYVLPKTASTVVLTSTK